MLASISLALLLSVPSSASEFEPAVRAFVDALVRRDFTAIAAGAPIPTGVGLAYPVVELHDDIAIERYRIAAVEPGAESTLVTVEMEGSAYTIGTGAWVPWPRWWSIELKRGEGGWQLASSMTLERRLAQAMALKSPAELSAMLREHPELDAEQFLALLASIASDAGADGCASVLWAVRESHERGHPYALSTAWQMLSYLGSLAMNPAETLWPAQRNFELAKAIGSADLLMEAHFQLGIGYWFSGRIDEAVAELTRSASYSGQVDDPRLPQRAAYMASHLEVTRGRLREALALAEMHQRMLSQYANARNALDNAFMLAVIQNRLGNIEIAYRHNERALELSRQLGDPATEAMALYNLAVVELALNSPEARERLEAAYRTGKGTLPPGDYTALVRTLIEVRSGEGDFEGAELALSEVGEMISGMQQPQALKEMMKNLTAGFHASRSRLRLAQGRLEEALADARTARAGADTTHYLNPLNEALILEGRALRRLSRLDEAEAAWRAAIDIAEGLIAEQPPDTTGQAMKMNQLLEPYRALLDLLVEENCAREALAIAERMRARSLRESLRHGRIDLSAGLDADKRARERALEQALVEANRALLAATDPEAIAKFGRQREEARLALRQFRSELYVSHPSLDRRRPGRDESLQFAAAPGEVVLELAVTDEATFAFVLRGSEVTARRIGISREALEKKAGELVAALEQRDLAWRGPARALHDLLLGPVAADLGSAARLRIVPDGALWRVPFHALIDAAGKHVCDRIAVAYSPSLALSRPRAADTGAPRTLLALADPLIGRATADATRALYRDVTLGRLPDAASEVRSIAPLYAEARVRIGGDAQEALFKEEAAAFRVLHLAAHSIVDDRAPMFSSIVLAASKANPLDDGLLEAREVADLDLNADLAVLSACETARGAVTPGEGMVGLSWAFLAAGVPTTVVSQWKVASASTAGLMVRFHRALRGGAAADEALRAAMADVRRDPRWQHPFYWAPFVVIENSGLPANRQ